MEFSVLFLSITILSHVLPKHFKFEVSQQLQLKMHQSQKNHLWPLISQYLANKLKTLSTQFSDPQNLVETC